VSATHLTVSFSSYSSCKLTIFLRLRICRSWHL